MNKSLNKDTRPTPNPYRISLKKTKYQNKTNTWSELAKYKLLSTPNIPVRTCCFAANSLDRVINELELTLCLLLLLFC